MHTRKSIPGLRHTYMAPAYIIQATVSSLAASAYLILPPAFIEDHVHDNAGEAHVILNHHLELRLILLLLCKTVAEYKEYC